MEDINKLKIDFATMSKQLEHLDEANNRIEEKLDNYIAEDKLWKKEFCDQLDKKYASKYVEAIVKGMVAILLSWALYQLLDLL